MKHIINWHKQYITDSSTYKSMHYSLAQNLINENRIMSYYDYSVFAKRYGLCYCYMNEETYNDLLEK